MTDRFRGTLIAGFGHEPPAEDTCTNDCSSASAAVACWGIPSWKALFKVFKVLRAQALLNGRMQAIPTDLDVLGYVTTFRISEDLNRNLPQVLAEVIQRVNE